ncbi:MAG: hypothetical protein KAJ55_10055 [Anaerolineales bacterium]|nr:hypothetical protein [Anaerolineales bacterium]
MEDETLGNPPTKVEVETVPEEPRNLPMEHPGREVGLAELAARKGEGLAIIEARAKILETLRKAAIRATSPEDWLLFRDKVGAVIGYLQDCGCDRVRDLYGIEVQNVGRPEKVSGEDGGSFTYLIMGGGYCGITHQTVEAIEGGRSSTDDFVRDKQGVELELAVRKAARANLDGNITRELAGLKSVPLGELNEAWKDSNKTSADCRLGRGFGSGAERQGADVQTGAGVPQSQAPKCPKCGGPMKFVRAKEGKYEAFWSCAKYQSGDCTATRPYVEPKAENGPESEESTAPPDGDPGPQDEDKGVHKDDIDF